MKKKILLLTLSIMMISSFFPIFTVKASALQEQYLWPVDGIYGMSRGYSSSESHYGVDIAAPSMTPVRATKSGWVYLSINNCQHVNNGYDEIEHPAGNYVQLVHDDGSGGS